MVGLGELQKPLPPASEDLLLGRAQALAGRDLQSIALELQVPIPTDSVHAKGWSGELLEQALGAAGTSEPEPDFPHLGVELKTIPILADGRAKESTHVCVVPLEDHVGLKWEGCLVRKKLARVLWVPLLSPRGCSLAERMVCSPLLWSPNQEQTSQLRQDWEELMEFVALGRVHQLTAHHGNYLQIRPKAASAKALTWTSDDEGRRVQTNPRGFYLRPAFTNQVLAQNFILPSKP